MEQVARGQESQELPNGPSVIISWFKAVCGKLAGEQRLWWSPSEITLVPTWSPVTRKDTILSGGQDEADYPREGVKMDWGHHQQPNDNIKGHGGFSSKTQPSCTHSELLQATPLFGQISC